MMQSQYINNMNEDEMEREIEKIFVNICIFLYWKNELKTKKPRILPGSRPLDI